ncbi:MAG: hypothetical protein J1F64_07950 [Oscillospiraceae bacterium]|nr:hypothetical protein [Oscillospiraceae bacterium]
MSEIIGFAVTAAGTVFCLCAKVIWEKLRVGEPSDSNVLKLKIVGLAIAVVGALMVFLM